MAQPKSPKRTLVFTGIGPGSIAPSVAYCLRHLDVPRSSVTFVVEGEREASLRSLGFDVIRSKHAEVMLEQIRSGEFEAVGSVFHEWNNWLATLVTEEVDAIVTDIGPLAPLAKAIAKRVHTTVLLSTPGVFSSDSILDLFRSSNISTWLGGSDDPIERCALAADVVIFPWPHAVTEVLRGAASWGAREIGWLNPPNLLRSLAQPAWRLENARRIFATSSSNPHKGFAITPDGFSNLIRAAFEAREGIEVIATVPGAPHRETNNFSQIDNCPHDALMQESDVIVCHGGWGSVSRALAYGRPLAVIPFTEEQAFNADVVRRLGAGRHVPPTATPAELAKAVSEMLESTSSERANAERLKAGRV